MDKKQFEKLIVEIVDNAKIDAKYQCEALSIIIDEIWNVLDDVVICTQVFAYLTKNMPKEMHLSLRREEELYNKNSHISSVMIVIQGAIKEIMFNIARDYYFAHPKIN